MDSILLVNPPKASFDRKNIWVTIKESSIPIGLAQLASFVREKNLKVDVIDLCACRLSEDDFREQIRRLNPHFVGFTSTTVQVNNGLRIAEIVKDVLPHVKIVFWGVHPAVLPDEVLSNGCVDFVVRGEGENTLTELSSGKSVSQIDGLSYKVGGGVVHNKARHFIEDLDSLPYPAYDLFDLGKYKPTLGNFKQLPSISMITSRGCPGTCTFCYSGVMGKRIRFMSAKKIFDEICFLHDEYGIRDINFYDDTFTAHKKNVMELCDMLITADLGLSWSCMSRLDYVSRDLLEKMKKAGCHQIGYGIESSNQKILENIKKRVHLDMVRDIVDLTKESGIDVRAMFMFGNPGETEKTMEDAIEFALNLDADLYLFNITTPYPGTEMFYWADKNGYLTTKNWDEYDLYHFVMKLPTVENEKIQEYYRKAYRRCYLRSSYIMKRLRKINSLNNLKAHIKMVPYLLRG